MHVCQDGGCSEMGSAATTGRGDNHSTLESSITKEMKGVHKQKVQLLNLKF